MKLPLRIAKLEDARRPERKTPDVSMLNERDLRFLAALPVDDERSDYSRPTDLSGLSGEQLSELERIMTILEGAAKGLPS